MKKSSLDAIFVLIIVITAAHFFSPARAQPTYSPGVIAGNSVTFGLIKVTWSSATNSTPPPFIQQLNQTKSILATVTNVAGKVVTVNSTYTYKNGTIQSSIGTVNVQDGSGTSNIFIIAGGLSAGYPIYQTSTYSIPYISETVTKPYAGALRPVNTVNVNNTSAPYVSSILLDWDAQTGFLLEVSESISYPGESYSIHFTATTTNVWSPSTMPDFGFDAIPQSPQPIHLGESATFNLLLNSTNNFAGTIHLTSTLLNTTLPKPALSLSRTSLSLSAGHLNSSILKFSTDSSTPLGLYTFSVNGTSGTLSHTSTIAVTVSPPDFDISATPANLTIAAGGMKSSVVTLNSLGSFSGTINLSFYTGPFLNVTLQPTTVTLSTTVASANSTLTVQVPPNAPPSGYFSVTVTGTSGTSLSHSFTLPIDVTGPDFRMSASPSVLTLKQGAIAQSTVTLTSILGFHGNVALSTFTSYGLTSTIDKTTVFLNSTTSPTVDLTIYAQANTPPGGYYSFVDGTSGNLGHSAEVSVNVIGPDLRITTNPSVFTLQEGTNATSTITVTSILGFHGNVALSASVYYVNGPTVQLNPANFTLAPNATATSKLTISTSSAVPGYYTVQVVATSNNLTRYGYISVQVLGPDFNISPSPFSLTLRQGSSGTAAISLSSLENFNGTIALSTFVSGPYPGGLTASISPPSVTLSSASPSATASLTITVPLYATQGYYSVQVTGTSGRLTHTAYVSVNVVGPDLLMTINPSNFILQQGRNASSIITLTSLQGFHGTVALTAFDFDSNGPTVSFNATTLTVAANATATSKLTISTYSALPGYYNIQVTATGGNLTRYGNISVQVLAPDFDVSISSLSLTLRQGTSVTSTVSLSRLENFNGTVSLSSFVTSGPYPGGLVTSISPTSVTLSSAAPSAAANLTLTAAQTATTGFYYVQVTATSGRLTHYAYISVDVTVAPNFGIVATSPADFNSGATGSSTITVLPSNGFSGSVTIATSTSPGTGLTPGCPNSLTVNVNGTAPITGTCHPTSTTPGTYVVKITATGGGLIRNATFVSSVGSFKISANTPADFNSGAGGQLPIIISSIDNFSGGVTLTGTSTTGLTVTCPTVAVTISANANGPSVCTLNSTTAGTYKVTIVANGSPGSYSQTTSVVVHVGDFTISASSGSINVGAPGASLTISLTSTFNFAGSVNLSAVVDPSTGVSVVCPTSAVPLTANATSVASCTLSPTSSDTYQITLTGKGTPGTASHDAISIVHVGDFAISVTPTDINSGSNGSISVSLTGINNFAGTISLSPTSSPSGLTITCPTTSIAANSADTTSCSVTSTDPGTYSVTITGTGSTGTSLHSASTVVHVGDFAISIGSPVNFNLGSPNSKVSVNLTSTLNFAGTVVLTADPNPATGLTVTCPAVTLFANSTSSTYCALNSDTTGTFLVTIKGSSLPGTGSHSSSGIVQVADFTVTASTVSPSTITVGSSGSSSITVSPINGFSGTVTLAVSPPSGIACSFDHTTIQSPGTSNLSCTGNTLGDYTVTVTALGSSTFHQISLGFHVIPAPAQVSTSTTMFGLQPPQFYSLLGGIIVAITIASVSVVLRRRK